MKNYSTQSGKKKAHSQSGLYITLAASVLMLSVAGYFAYSQTKDSLEGQLDSSISLSESINNASIGKNNVKKDDAAQTTTTTRATTTRATTTTTAAATTTAPVQAESTAAQPFVYPVSGDIINDFSDGELVKSTTTGIWQTHNGIDIAADEGAAVKSMTSGTVTAVELDPLWGYCVTIDHGNGISARYCNLSEGLSVTEGANVNAGTVLGTVGKSADIESSMPSHLHFEVMQHDSFTDPCQMLG
ncbi:MAG: M23 family metallopeptidase [Oscillospiraceae bacterium]|nr:M23 family metallopeptidase [Oscillospiraceae bacterium]